MINSKLIAALLDQLHSLIGADVPWLAGLSAPERKLIARAAMLLIGRTGEMLAAYADGEDIDETLKDLIASADELGSALHEEARMTVAARLTAMSAPPAPLMPLPAPSGAGSRPSYPPFGPVRPRGGSWPAIGTGASSLPRPVPGPRWTLTNTTTPNTPAGSLAATLLSAAR